MESDNKSFFIKENKNARKCTAVLLENQRIYNDKYLQDHPIRHKLFDLIRGVFKNSPLFDLISIQPILREAGIVFFLDYKPESSNLGLNYEEVFCETKSFKIPLLSDEDFNNEDRLGDACNALHKAIYYEVIRDTHSHSRLYRCSNQNCVTVSEKSNNIRKAILTVSDIIDRKTYSNNLGSYNWAIVSKELANIILNDSDQCFNPSAIQRVTRCGSVNNISIYVDPLFARNKILMGRRGATYLEAGYIYSPHVFAIPEIVDGHNRIYQLKTTYSKMLTPNGHNFYARILCDI